MVVPTFLRFHKGDDPPLVAPGPDHEDFYPKVDGRWYRRGSDGIEHLIEGVADDDPRLTDARTPTTHGHTIAQVTGLQSALTGTATSAQGAKADTAVQPAALTAAIDNLKGTAPGLLDTLGEIATQMGNDESAVAALTTTVAGKATAAQGAKADTAVQPAALTSAITTSEGGQVRDGDPAGGVLAGNFPNPTFAADMATQAELDAVDTAKVPTARTISTSAPLSGGGALSGNLTLSIPAATTSAAGHLAATDKKQLDDLKVLAFATPGATVLTTTETVVMSLPLPANSVKVGTTFNAVYAGIPGLTSATTMRVRIGPAGTIADPAVLACAGPATATTAVRGEMTAAVTAVGASAAFTGVGAITNAAAVGGTMTGPTGTFNSGVANILTVTIQSGTTNTHTVRAGVVQAFNLA